MSIRTFIFCDFCNPQGIRYVEQRRTIDRGDRDGRRITDGRAWYEGGHDDVKTAVTEHGWAVTTEGKHICPHCQQHLQDEVSLSMTLDFIGDENL